MATFSKYRSKPVVVDAVQLTTSNVKEIKELLGKGNYSDKPWDPVNIHLNTGHGEAIAVPGTWIIKDSEGKFYPCSDGAFKEKYEVAGGK